MERLWRNSTARWGTGVGSGSLSESSASESTSCEEGTDCQDEASRKSKSQVPKGKEGPCAKAWWSYGQCELNCRRKIDKGSASCHFNYRVKGLNKQFHRCDSSVVKVRDSCFAGCKSSLPASCAFKKGPSKGKSR